MIRLDHDGHEIDRDPEPVEKPLVNTDVQDYWDRLARDLRDAKQHSTFCPCGGCKQRGDR